jgi:hypothetical protein
MTAFLVLVLLRWTLDDGKKHGGNGFARAARRHGGPSAVVWAATMPWHTRELCQENVLGFWRAERFMASDIGSGLKGTSDRAKALVKRCRFSRRR